MARHTDATARSDHQQQRPGLFALPTAQPAHRAPIDESGRGKPPDQMYDTCARGQFDYTFGVAYIGRHRITMAHTCVKLSASGYSGSTVHNNADGNCQQGACHDIVGVGQADCNLALPRVELELLCIHSLSLCCFGSGGCGGREQRALLLVARFPVHRLAGAAAVQDRLAGATPAAQRSAAGQRNRRVTWGDTVAVDCTRRFT